MLCNRFEDEIFMRRAAAELGFRAFCEYDILNVMFRNRMDVGNIYLQYRKPRGMAVRRMPPLIQENGLLHPLIGVESLREGREVAPGFRVVEVERIIRVNESVVEVCLRVLWSSPNDWGFAPRRTGFPVIWKGGGNRATFARGRAQDRNHLGIIGELDRRKILPLETEWRKKAIPLMRALVSEGTNMPSVARVVKKTA